MSTQTPRTDRILKLINDEELEYGDEIRQLETELAEQHKFNDSLIASNLRMRGALELAITAEPSKAVDIARAVLSTPTPQVVPLEDVKHLLSALEQAPCSCDSLRKTIISPRSDGKPWVCSRCEALAIFTTKHPIP